MRMRRTSWAPVGLLLAIASPVLAAPPDGPLRSITAQSENAFSKAYPEASFYRTGSRITSVYGSAFSTGPTARASVESFRATYSGLFGVTAAELVEGTLATDGVTERPMMPDLETGRMKFTLLSYLQLRDGVPVFRGELRLLVRNDPGFPLVLARAEVRDLGAFRVSRAAAENPNIAGALTDAMLRFPGIGGFTAPRIVIWAGVDSTAATPRLAVEFTGTVGNPALPGYDRLLILADASTGKVLWSESLICHADISGSVKGMATPPTKADICTNEVLTPMPYAQINGPAGPIYADSAGGFVYPSSVLSTLTSGVRGKWFRVSDVAAGALDPELLSGDFAPPGPAAFVHNQSNTVPAALSGVNAYINANVARDFALKYSPNFPTITTQTDFKININVGGLCNAFYDGVSINFFPAGGACPSSAYSAIVQHEYTHHLVASAGSGQGAYGEGAADMMAMLISDESGFGFGFYGNCASPMREGANTCQYSAANCSSCGSEIHTCGQLLTGAVWSTRNAIAAINPSTYREILSAIAVNSIKLHTGELITPQVTIDFLTLDDDDSSIGNGTPHYAQINQGFSAHGMPAPVLNTLSFVFPQGRPTRISPAGGLAFTVQVIGSGNTTPIQTTGQFFLDNDDNGTYTQSDMIQISPNYYKVIFPATPCGTKLRYYFSTGTTTGINYNPTGAPTSAYYTAISGASIKTAFCDDFESDKGWTTSKTAGVTTGDWQRAIPVNNNRGDPTADYDGSGKCFVTDNRAGDFDIDGGSVSLTSPAFDATGADDAYFCYARWFSNNFGNNPNSDTMAVLASNDNGNTWVNVETVGPTTDAAGGWKYRQMRLGSLLPLTSTMKVRFTANDTGNASTVEAGIDDVKVLLVNCTKCYADFNLDGFVNGVDFDDFVAAFEFGECTADVDNSGFVNGDDFDSFSAAFEAGC